MSSYSTQWREANPEAAQRQRDAQHDRRLQNPDVRNQQNAHAREYRRTLKLAAYAAYGGFVCGCCGVTAESFLTLDHTNNDGAAHRRLLGSLSSAVLYRWLRDNNYPSGFQVSCWNCNIGRQQNGGVCPHKELQ